MSSRDAAAPSARDAPCCVVRLRAAEWSDAAAAISSFEERVAAAASPFGRVLDVRLGGALDARTREVRVYFADAAAAVCCGPRFECNGVQRVAHALENFPEPPVVARVGDLPKPKDAALLAGDVGGECSEHVRRADMSPMNRGGAAARTFRGDAPKSRRPFGRRFESSRAARPRPRRG